jgi:isopentenyl-diphosphate delta-isomerase
VEHSSRDNGFAKIELPVIALPELAWDDIDTSTQFLGRSFKAPILITGMTGGVAQGTLINERLAAAATAHNLPMGVGSQRMALENPAYADIFRVKRKFPKLFLIGNIGIGQLRSSSYLDLCERAVDMITADALAIHVNVLQELIQVEGDRDFRGIIDKIGHIKSKLKVPLLVKEVGVGMDVNSAKRLAEVGITCFDVGGAGGTSWAAIEGLRANDPLIQRRGEIFRNWGIPTAKAISDLRSTLPNATLVATGGIRDGLTVLKALHLGANMAGIGLPLMRAALESEDQASKLLASMIDELKIAKMCSGL